MTQTYSADIVSARAFLNPFRAERSVCETQAGLTITQIVGEHARPSVHVWLGDIRISRAWWNHVTPKPGVTLFDCVLPEGGDSNKNFQTVAQLAILVASQGTAYGGFVFAAGTFALNIGPADQSVRLGGSRYYGVGRRHRSRIQGVPHEAPRPLKT